MFVTVQRLLSDLTQVGDLGVDVSALALTLIHEGFEVTVDLRQELVHLLKARLHVALIFCDLLDNMAAKCLVLFHQTSILVVDLVQEDLAALDDLIFAEFKVLIIVSVNEFCVDE
jgi:hypothetical protein